MTRGWAPGPHAHWQRMTFADKVNNAQAVPTNPPDLLERRGDCSIWRKEDGWEVKCEKHGTTTAAPISKQAQFQADHPNLWCFAHRDYSDTPVSNEEIPQVYLGVWTVPSGRRMWQLQNRGHVASLAEPDRATVEAEAKRRAITLTDIVYDGDLKRYVRLKPNAVVNAAIRKAGGR